MPKKNKPFPVRLYAIHHHDNKESWIETEEDIDEIAIIGEKRTVAIYTLQETVEVSAEVVTHVNPR